MKSTKSKLTTNSFGDVIQYRSKNDQDGFIAPTKMVAARISAKDGVIDMTRVFLRESPIM